MDTIVSVWFTQRHRRTTGSTCRNVFRTLWELCPIDWFSKAGSTWKDRSPADWDPLIRNQLTGSRHFPFSGRESLSWGKVAIVFHEEAQTRHLHKLQMHARSWKFIQIYFTPRGIHERQHRSPAPREPAYLTDADGSPKLCIHICGISHSKHRHTTSPVVRAGDGEGGYLLEVCCRTARCSNPF